MIESGVKILGLDIIEDLDGAYFPVETVAEGTKRVSWDTLKADLLGSYELWPHDVPGGTDEIVTLRNTSLTDPFTIFELRAPENSATLEATLSLHAYSPDLGQDWVRDLSLHNYNDYMGAFDVLSNFSDATRGRWEWLTRAIDGGVGVFRLCARLDGEDGSLYLGGNLNPITSDAQNLGSEDEIWSNAFIGYVKAAAVKVTGNYRFDDGTTVYTGATGTFTTANGKTVTVKGGIITGIV